MPLDQKLALIAVFAQVALTFHAVVMTGLTRVRSIKDNGIRLSDISVASTSYPDAVRQQGNNLNNQFEFPVLLYVAVLMALVLNAVTMPFALACLVFVITRFAHRLVHVTGNDVRTRFKIFLLGIAFLAGAWVILGLTLLGLI